ncbi:MAG: RMD1 family protein [Gammaproteobacteria bacterium]|jgi:uncharacterized Rmd1/YagE family protein
METAPAEQLFQARAVLVGERIDMRAIESLERLGSNPLVVPASGNGRTVLFRYGVVVFFDVPPMEQASFLEQLRPFVREPQEPPETETLQVRIVPGEQHRLTQDQLTLGDDRVQSLQTVADILAKSVMLAKYERSISQTFDRIEPMAADLSRTGRGKFHGRRLAQYIGDTLMAMQRMVGRVEVSEKPELLWEHPELEGLYLRLEDDYEIRERHRALERKIDVIARTAETLLDLLQTKQSHRVEWYITLLIVVEILLSLYEMFIRPHHG